jgi:hypothetical protein
MNRRQLCWFAIEILKSAPLPVSFSFKDLSIPVLLAYNFEAHGCCEDSDGRCSNSGMGPAFCDFGLAAVLEMNFRYCA